MSFNRIIECKIGDNLITDLKITFEINKTISASINTAKIKIYNLSDETTKKVIGSNLSIQLKAGYEDEGGSKNIFFGNITRTIDSKVETERILEIEAGDGVIEIKDSLFSKSYKEGTTVKQLITNLTNNIGLPVRGIGSIPQLQYSNGFSFSGYSLDCLETVLAYAGKTYSIQNGEIVLLSPNETYTVTGVTISPTTGLLGHVEELWDSTSETSTEAPQGYVFKSLLYPDLIPGGTVYLNSDKITGTFKLDSVTFIGDNFDTDFYAECEVKTL